MEGGFQWSVVCRRMYDSQEVALGSGAAVVDWRGVLEPQGRDQGIHGHLKRGAGRGD